MKPYAEQMITLGRRGDLHARRQATAFLRSRDVVHKLFADVAPLFKDRPGGYTRIVKLGPRRGDAAEMAILEFIGYELASDEKKAAPAKGSKKGKVKVSAEPEAPDEETPAKKTASKKPAAPKKKAEKKEAPAEEKPKRPRKKKSEE